MASCGSLSEATVATAMHVVHTRDKIGVTQSQYLCRELSSTSGAWALMDKCDSFLPFKGAEPGQVFSLLQW
jgi:hypothetical protein